MPSKVARPQLIRGFYRGTVPTVKGTQRGESSNTYQFDTYRPASSEGVHSFVIRICRTASSSRPVAVVM